MPNEGGNLPLHPREPVFRAAFARVLNELRTEAGMSQGAVAAASGYTLQYISNLENRESTPTLTAFGEIVLAMNASPGQAMDRVVELLPKFAYLEAKTADPGT